MFDEDRPILKAMVTPNQPPEIRMIEPVAHQRSGRDKSTYYGSNALGFSRNTHQNVPQYYERNSINGRNNDHTVIEGHPSLEQIIYSGTNQVNIKDSLMAVIASISPETLESIIKFVILLLTSHANGNETPQAQAAIPADNQLRDTLQLVLAACGLKFPKEEVESSKEFPKKVKTVFDEMIKYGYEIFQKVDLTKALQKKLNAKEIDAVLEFLISEGGVLEKIEQKKRSKGRTPSPHYRLLWNNPKYFQGV